MKRVSKPETGEIEFKSCMASGRPTLPKDLWKEISLREGLALKELLIDEMAKNTGQKRDKVQNDMERDYWMNAKEAKKYGIVDEVLTK
jgi:ATP-dependent protease ClpP protease subunit